MSDYFVHESSFVDDGATVGDGTKVWHFCHVMPGAVIGERCNLGQNVVVMPGTKIGNNVKIYQGVTLGALRFPRGPNGELIRGQKRHPTIEDDVIIYAGATILGGDTVVGEGSTVGGNVWLVESVPPYTTVAMESPELKYKDRTGSK